MNDLPGSDPGLPQQRTDAPRLGRRLIMSASLAAPTLFTLGRAAYSQKLTVTQNKKKKGKSMGTASQLASIKKRKGKG
jgi:hypothetical protein